MLETLVEQIDPGRPCRALDVGCGTGVATRVLAASCQAETHVTAIDVSRYLLSEAEDLFAPAAPAGVSAEFVPGMTESLPLDDDSVDAAITATMLEETDADAALAELARVTRPGGRIAVVVRSVDEPRIVDAPLPADLARRVETDPRFTSGRSPDGCADASLYRRLGRVGLTTARELPQMVRFSEPDRLAKLTGAIVGKLDAESGRVFREAVRVARDAGTFSITQPFHCAVATVPG